MGNRSALITTCVLIPVTPVNTGHNGWRGYRPSCDLCSQAFLRAEVLFAFALVVGDEDAAELGEMVRLGSTDCPEKPLTAMEVRCVAQAQAELVRLLAGVGDVPAA